MWKKDEGTPGADLPGGTMQDRERPKPMTTTGERATIGRSITIKGDISGDEDLLVQGTVEGSVKLESHAVTVGSEGRVHADITGRIITVEGEVEGNLVANEQIILRGSARVEGDIKAPRVVLDDGANFRGLVDMGAPRQPERAAARESGSEGKAATNGWPKGESAAESAESVATSSTARAPAKSTSTAGSKDKGVAGTVEKTAR
jgi:cytoskeletal protein CcmA (bactofilin family)